MQIGRGEFTYEWIDNWASIPDTASGRENGRTHGIAGLADGRVVVFHQASPGVLIFDEHGKLQQSWGEQFGGAHGMTLVHEDDQPRLWLTDQDSAAVVKTSVEGEILQHIDRPDHDIYREGGRYVPTWVAVNEKARGGNGDIWVADGYGSSLVHRYDAQGQYIASISGERGAGRFACPHGIAFDFRRGAGELYVADRGNRRVQVFDAEGNYQRTVGAQTLHSPCMFDFHEQYCLVPELFARVDILDADDQLVATLGDNGEASMRPGWPNHNKSGHPQWIKPGRFNSPHGACFGSNGDIYVAEWIIGGRITKLQRV